jgi:hypothetical protein
VPVNLARHEDPDALETCGEPGGGWGPFGADSDLSRPGFRFEAGHRVAEVRGSEMCTPPPWHVEVERHAPASVSSGRWPTGTCPCSPRAGRDGKGRSGSKGGQWGSNRCPLGRIGRATSPLAPLWSLAPLGRPKARLMRRAQKSMFTNLKPLGYRGMRISTEGSRRKDSKGTKG